MVVRKGAYDHFDTVLCVGQHQIDELRETEEMYNLPAKNLVPCGYGLLDDLIASYEKMGDVINDPKVILIAPSWQPDNILDSCIDNMLDSLFKTNYCIIVRPHPEYIKRFPAKMERLISKYKDKIGNNFNIETDFSSNTSIFSADLLITDWSGIAFEFSFTTKRPSLFIDTNEGFTLIIKYKNQPLDISLRNQVGISIKPDEVDKVCNIVHNLISEEIICGKLNKYESNIYNISESGRFGADIFFPNLLGRNNS